MSHAENRRANRKALLQAAWRLFAEQGYEDTSMDAVAETAGVSRRTAFRYFPSKHDLVFHDFAERRSRFAAAATEARGFGAVSSLLLGLAAEVERDAEFELARWALVQRSPALLAADAAQDRELEAIVADALARSEGPERAQVLAGALFGAIRATLRAWFEAGCPPDLPDRGRRTLAWLEAGLPR